jgi:hypothetical protein
VTRTTETTEDMTKPIRLIVTTHPNGDVRLTILDISIPKALQETTFSPEAFAGYYEQLTKFHQDWVAARGGRATTQEGKR